MPTMAKVAVGGGHELTEVIEGEQPTGSYVDRPCRPDERRFGHHVLLVAGPHVGSISEPVATTSPIVSLLGGWVRCLHPRRPLRGFTLGDSCLLDRCVGAPAGAPVDRGFTVTTKEIGAEAMWRGLRDACPGSVDQVKVTGPGYGVCTGADTEFSKDALRVRFHRVERDEQQARDLALALAAGQQP